ncbi:unnamed protein product [Ixodes persulcatus]
MFVLYMSFMAVSLNESAITSVLVGLLICCPEPMFLADLAFLTAAKSRIIETLMMGEALVGLSILWFVKHVVAKVTTAGEYI